MKPSATWKAKAKRPKAPWYQAAHPDAPAGARKARKRVPRQSRSRSLQDRLYQKRVKIWRAQAENRRCKVLGCPRPTSDCHHTRGKIGELLLDERFWMPVCRQHHDWIGANPAEARALGLLPPVGQWNTRPE